MKKTVNFCKKKPLNFHGMYYKSRVFSKMSTFKSLVSFAGVTAETTSSIECAFGYSNLCSWRQSDTDDFDWKLTRGPTQTANTGPSADHTGSKYSTVFGTCHFMQLVYNIKITNYKLVS